MTLVFLHIDKTGGMTVRELLAAHYEPQAIKPVPHNPKASAAALNYPTARPDLWLANRLFWMDYRLEHQLVMGHYDWGVLQYIDDPLVMTVLREPVAWFMSLYRYICQERAMYQEISDMAREDGPLAFLRKMPRSWENAQTAQLAGIRWTGGGIVGEEGYHAARANLEHCAYVGVTEALDSFLADVHLGMGWTLPDIPQRNVTRYEADVPDGLETYMRQHSPYDFLMYEQAKARALQYLS